MNYKIKRIGLLFLGLVLTAALTACAANANPNLTHSPTSPMMGTASPFGTEPFGTGLNTPAVPLHTPAGEVPTLSMTGAESSALSKKANDATVRISEIDSCVTAIIGDTCIVGVTFDPQYKGVLTDRIKDMVAARIQSVAPDVARVAVTVDPAIAAQIGSVAEKISKANALGELTGEFDSVLSKIQ